LSRRFGSLDALKPLTTEFVAGEVHAVVGENGAGKSTLMNILGGFLEPSGGEVTWGNNPYPIGSAQKCREIGIEMVHQHFMLVPEFTVEENLRLSLLGLSEANGLALLKVKAEEFGWEIPWNEKVKNLPVGIQQRIEILKTLTGNAQLLIFDEPTAVLSQDEAEHLIGFLRSLARSGKIVIVIAHKIDEVLAVADRVTVLRRGEHIVTVNRQHIEPSQLIEWMVGEPVEVLYHSACSSSENLLVAENLEVVGDRGENSVRGVSFEIRKGEIYGVGGVDGNGQLELSEALAQVRKIVSGRLSLRTENIGFVPQDRRVDGLALDMSIQENLLVSALGNHGFVIRPNVLRKWSDELVRRFSIKVQRSRDLVKSLSGGNQQKVILARVLSQNPELIVVVNPTRGLDVKAASFVRQQLLTAAANGAAVVLFSADRDELSEVTSKVQWMSRGRLYSTEAEALT
jgi:general nucleoside transport system ATP-binding protein